MKKLYFLFGYPASGKTTLAKKATTKTNFERVSTDDIYDELYNKGYHYREIRSQLCAKTLETIIEKGRCNQNIVLDCYQPRISERKPLLDNLPKTYEKIAVIMNASAEECVRAFKKRAHLRKDYIPPFSSELIEYPSLSEFDRIISEDDFVTIIS